MAANFIIAIAVVLVILAVLAVLVAVGMPIGPKKLQEKSTVSDSLRAMVLAQRADQEAAGTRNRKKGDRLALAAAAEVELEGKKRTNTSKLTLEKALRYGRWPITPLQFRAIQIVAGFVLFVPARMQLTTMWQVLAPIIGWITVMSFLRKSINKRFTLFDQDYPVLLLSYVSLLKTGMTTISGLEAAAKGLDEFSLVRAEVELLIERLRLGLTEEQAISAFGEDIHHPEIELFVQSLLLSKKVGGQLSNTLERLAKQVRKRQEFRKRALAAIGMERGSMWAIGAIMSALMFYIAFKSPDLVIPAFSHPMGQNMFQTGAALILVGVYWMKVVTNIKV